MDHVGHDLDHGLDHDVGHDLDHGLDHDVGHDLDHGLDHDVGHDLDHGLTVVENSTPFMLLFSTYCLWLGVTGVFTYAAISNKIVWVAMFLTIPVVLSRVVSLAWKRIARNVTYHVPRGRELVGMPAWVTMTVSPRGGQIRVPVGGPKAWQRLPARCDAEAKIAPGERVVIRRVDRGVHVVEPAPKRDRS
ncbi:MAG: hypothetical protein Kow0069_37260 [Promethearchaeota archaeon]